MKIVVIDSGIDKNVLPFIKKQYEIDLSENERVVRNEAEDELGHGTAIVWILHRLIPEAEIVPIKVFDRYGDTTAERVIEAMRFALEELVPDIIHMSNGFVCCAQREELQQIISDADDKGTVIVSAFDNFGAVSYPAACSKVLGVDTSQTLRTGWELIEDEGERIQILVPDRTIQAKWLNGENFSSGGNSFNACFLTGMVARMRKKGFNREAIVEELRKGAEQHILLKRSTVLESRFSAGRAVVFPFNKEMHSVIRYAGMLPFGIEKVLDSRYYGRTGKHVSEFIGNMVGKDDPAIESIENFSWENTSFDTFILGHVSEMEMWSGRKWSREILQNCLRYGKNLITLFKPDRYEYYENRFREKGLHLHYPCMTLAGPQPGGKLYGISAPVLGVFGTSSRQGKFSLQLAMREEMRNRGYKVAGLATEPEGELFGFEGCYPNGHEAVILNRGEDGITAINQIMHRIDEGKPDIIIVGGQSQTVPQMLGNVNWMMTRQHELLLGTQPDMILLCVNPFDDTTYIRRTINYIEALIDTPVGALILFPFEREIKGGILTNKLTPLADDKRQLVISSLQKEFARKVFVNAQETEAIADYCINFFSGE